VSTFISYLDEIDRNERRLTDSYGLSKKDFNLIRARIQSSVDDFNKEQED
jgi:hypothetical protein